MTDLEPTLAEGEEWLSRAEVMEEEGITERLLTERIASGYYRSKKEGKHRWIAFKRNATGFRTGAQFPPAADFWREFYEMKAELKVSNERIEELKENLRRERQHADIANTQLVNATTALQKWREKENTTLKGKSPWKFWG